MEALKQEVKIPQTKYAVLPEIVARWSPRSFSERIITDEEMATLVEAASWAPSSTNDQPWRYLYVQRGTAEFDAIFETLMPGNRAWADKASTFVVSLAKTTFSNGMPNRHAMYDVGAANTLLLVQGASMGIFGHQMGGFDMQSALKLLNLPPEFELACIIALGFLDIPDKLEEPFRTREITPRSRRPITDILQKGLSL